MLVRSMNATAPVSSIGASLSVRDGVRLARVERHVAAGCIALVVTVLLLDHLASPPRFLAFVIAVGVTVSCFARAVDAGFGRFYGWVYGEPTTATFLDRMAFRVIHRRRYGQRFMSPSSRPASDRHVYAMARPDEPRVQIVEIDATELLARFEESPDL
jgi:hypothetical protein